MIISVRQLGGDQVLAGASFGEEALPAFLEAVRPAVSGDVVEVDFAGVQVMTGSFFNKAIFPIWDVARRSEWFPLLRSVGDIPRGDIELVLTSYGQPAWATASGSGRSPDDAAVVGPDDAQQDAILRRAWKGPVTAATLYEEDRSVRSTAWSNRLAQLHERLLLRRRKVGRQLVYELPWSGGQDG